MLNIRKALLTLLAAGTVLVQQGTVSAGTISMNFTGRTSGFNTPVLLHVEFGDSATGVAGVNENDVWNDLIVYADNGTRGTIGPWRVAGSAGEEAIVTLSSRGTWGQTIEGTRIVPHEDPSGDMMDGHIEGVLGDFAFTVTVWGLSDDFPAFDVYAYVGDGNGGRSGEVTLNGSSTVPYISKIFDGTFVEATEGSSADYVVFRGVTGDSFTLTGGGINYDNRTGIHGLEIVGIPEPSTFVLAVLAALGLGLYGWRRYGR